MYCVIFPFFFFLEAKVWNDIHLNCSSRCFFLITYMFFSGTQVTESNKEDLDWFDKDLSDFDISDEESAKKLDEKENVASCKT